MDEKDKILTICMDCKKIKLNDNSWISEQIAPKLYNKAKAEYRLSHGYCPTCGEEELKKIESEHSQESKHSW